VVRDASRCVAVACKGQRSKGQKVSGREDDSVVQHCVELVQAQNMSDGVDVVSDVLVLPH